MVKTEFLNRTVVPGPQPWTIVLAAGEGTRLRALTRALYGTPRPKQFAVIQGEKSLLQMTLSRSAIWSPAEQTVVVVAQDWEQLARFQVRELQGVDLVAQPRNLGTGPGVLLPLARVLERDPAALALVVPSDHYVRDIEPFVDSLARAERLARRNDSVVLIGAVPDRPETQYGWIVPSPGRAGRGVSHFHEKPGAALAKELFEGGALWNTFVMIARAEVLWSMLQTEGELVEMVRHVR